LKFEEIRRDVLVATEVLAAFNAPFARLLESITLVEHRCASFKSRQEIYDSLTSVIRSFKEALIDVIILLRCRLTPRKEAIEKTFMKLTRAVDDLRTSSNNQGARSSSHIHPVKRFSQITGIEFVYRGGDWIIDEQVNFPPRKHKRLADPTRTRAELNENVQRPVFYPQ
jgi:hypothetical protein